MKSSNPVLGRLVDRSTRHASFHRAPVQQPYGQPGYGGGYASTPDSYSGYAPAVTERMTVDDVVVRTITLLGITGVFAALAWVLLDRSPLQLPVVMGAAVVGLVLGLIISFARVTNPIPIVAYAAVEGVLIGVISRMYETAYSGIVVQALAATFGIFFGMAALYKFRVIRATPTFVKWVTGALIGVFVLMLVNFLLSVLHVGGGAGLGLRSGGAIAVGFSLLCIGIAALTFIIDFAAVEEGVNAGVARKYSWYASFGIVVGLIWLYLEILRLLGYARR